MRYLGEALHYANAGGAVDNRDQKGEKERKNIATSSRKWPGCLRPNHKRANEVILKWKGVADSAADGSDDGEGVQVNSSKKASKKARKE